MRKRGRVDEPQQEIVAALRRVGWDAWSLAPLGKGKADLLACHLATGRLVLMEVKSRRGRLTADQLAVHQRWPIQVVRSVDEAMKAIGVRT
jgi:hypothetical protein